MTRQIQLHRTPEWARISGTDFFKIEDLPGEIIVSKGPLPVFACAAMAVVFFFGPLLMSQWLLPLSIGFGGIWAWAALRNINHSFKVRFTADQLTFYGPLGDQKGTLSRESMQQIAVNVLDEKRDMFCHEFIADTGWMNAFYGKGRTKGSVQNNVLMAAFAQPVHLDLLQDAPSFDADPQPQLRLRPRAVS